MPAPSTLSRPATPGRRYVLRTASLMAVYVLIHAAAIAGLFDSVLGQPAGWLVAMAVALPVAGQIWATLRFMADSDEYVRAVTAKCFILAAGATMALWTAWGFGETYAAAPHIAGWLLYPVFWAMYGLATPLVHAGR